MPSAGVSHDLTIEDVGGTNKIGFMRYRGAKQLGRGNQVSDIQLTAPRIITDSEAALNEFPPDVVQYWYQNDWTYGIGGYIVDDKRLQEARSVDASNATVGLQPARKLTATTINSGTPNENDPTGFAVVGTEFWAFIGRDLYKWDFINKYWDENAGGEPVAAANIYRNGVAYKGDTYVPSWVSASGAPTKYIHKADEDSDWTVIGTSSGKDTYKYFAVANGQLWGGYNAANKHVVQSTTAPDTVANWGDAVSVGTSESAITALVGDGDTLIICKTNGIWALYPDTGAENLTPDFVYAVADDNFKGSFNWNGHIIMPLAKNGMLDLYQGRIYDRSIYPYVTSEGWRGNYQGRVVAITGTPTELWIVIVIGVNNLSNINDVVILRGVWVDEAFRWHHESQFDPTGTPVQDRIAAMAERMAVGTDEHDRIWFGFDTGHALDGKPYFIPRVMDDDDDLEDNADTSVDNFQVRTIRFEGLPQFEKTFGDVLIETSGLTGSNKLLWEYDLDEQGSWQTTLADSAGHADGVIDVSRWQTMTFPDGTTGKAITFRITRNAGVADFTIASFRLSFTIRPDRRQLFPLRIYLADKQRGLNGGLGITNPKKDLAQLRTWQGQAAEVKIIDEAGTATQAVFLPGKFDVIERVKERHRRSEYVVSCVLAEV